MRLALLVALLVLSPLAAAQVPLPPVPLPVPVPVPTIGPEPDQGTPGYLAFDCPSDAAPNSCPVRESQRGETLTQPALAFDATAPERVLLASLAGAAHDRVAVRLSSDAGATFARTLLPDAGAGALALGDDGAGGAILAVATSSGIVVRRAPFEALPAAQPEATIPAASATRLSHARANGTDVLAWAEGASARVAWARPGEAWRVASVECATPSNVVAPAARALLACVVPEAIPDEDVPANHVALFALNETAGNLTRLSDAPVQGEPQLVLNRTRNLTMVAVALESPRVAHLRLAYSRNGSAWSLPLDVGARVHPVNATPLATARVTALAYQPASDTLHLVWAQTPAAPNATDARYQKSLVALSTRGQLLFRHDLDVDEPAARVAGNALQVPFVDAHDALLVQGTREYLAFGDDGALVRGALVERATSSRAVAPPVQDSTQQGLVINLLPPPPKFTLGFSIAAGLLALGIVARVLVGRIRATTSSSPDKKEGP